MSAARDAFVQRLTAKRGDLGLTRAEVGAQVGVCGATVGKWETNVRLPSLAHAVRWAEVLGVRVVGGSLELLFRPRAAVAACGTASGYRRHGRLGEQRCGPCREAWNAERAAGRAQARRRARAGL